MKKYWTAHIDPIWDHSFKSLVYEYLPHKDQTMVQQWLDQGYNQTQTLNGAVHTFRDNIPDYARPLCNRLAWNDMGCQLFRMNTGDIIPMHQDHYLGYSRAMNITDLNRIWRAVVFLEDWKSGHYLEINSEAFTGWAAGDYVVWNNDVPHMAANIGIDPRYTLQITGWV